MNLETKWTSKKQFFFFFFLTYFFLFCFPFPFDIFTGFFEKSFMFLSKKTGSHLCLEISTIFHKMFFWWDSLLLQVTTLIAKNVFSIDQPILNKRTGSSDKLFNFIRIFFIINLSLLTAIASHFINNKYKNFPRLLSFLITACRYFVAIMLIKYGFTKVFQNQFPTPYLARYVQQFGDSSPEGLAWFFMGYSKEFKVFTGVVEIICAIFLLFRNTKLLGAVLSVLVCTVIFTMNLCYDIPVKLFSGHLLAFSLFLVLLDYKNLWLFFVKGKSTKIKAHPYFFANYKRKNLFLYLKWFIILFVFLSTAYGEANKHNQTVKHLASIPLYGIYNLKSKTLNNKTIPLIYNDSSQWKQLIIYNDNWAAIKFLNDSIINLNFIIDTNNNKIICKNWDKAISLLFDYKLENDTLTLFSQKKIDTVCEKFIRFNETNFLLNSREFHWLTETPLNK